MSVAFSLTERHRVAAANSHWYHQPTSPLYLDRVLPCHDFIYLEAGQWTITENSTDFLLEPGDVLILSAGHHHYTRLPCAPDTRTMCLHISREPGDVPGHSGTLMLPSLIHAAFLPAIRARFQEIVSAVWGDGPHREGRLSALFELLLYDLADARPGVQAPDSSLAQEIIDILRASPHLNFRVEDICAAVHASEKAVNDAIQKRSGMTFARYQAHIKLEMAAQHIRMEPDIRLKEIAAMYGFCDEFHLSKAFKAKYGVSPSQYRQKPVPQ